MKAINKKLSSLPTYTSFLLVVILGYTLAKLFWLILTPISDIKSLTPPNNLTNTVSLPVSATKNYAKIIAEHHLFGEIKEIPTQTSQPKHSTQTKTVPTKLNLKLHGIVALKNDKGYALISTSGGEQKVYAKGDTVQTNVTIIHISEYKVTLNNGGKTEELLLPRDSELKSGNSSSPVNRFIPPPNNPYPPRTNNNFFGGMTNPVLNPNNRLDPVPNSELNELAQFKQDVMKDPSKLMDIATPSPANKNGEFIGFRVQPGSNRQLFRKVGFQPNDIITSVNGILLDEPTKGALVLNELSGASSINITVLRGEESVNLQAEF